MRPVTLDDLNPAMRKQALKQLSGGKNTKAVASPPRIQRGMNGTEAEYLRQLGANSDIERIYFNKITLKLADDTRYTPDFVCVHKDGAISAHEVKGGFVRDDAKVKFKVACEMYPLFRWVWAQKVKGVWAKEEL